MNTKEKHDRLKKDMAKLLTEKKMLDLKMELFLEEKENMRKL